MQWGKRWAFFMGHRRASVPLSLLPLYFFDPHVYERFIFQIFPFICRHFIRIPDRSAVFFSGFTNNASPMFVIYFVGGSLLHLGNERYVFYLLLLVSSFLGSFCTWLLLRRNPANTHFLPKSAEKKESTNSLSLFDQFDLELNQSAELLIKIGCYILVFSVLTSFLKQTVFFGPLPTSLLCGILEITTGNHLLCQSLADSPIITALSLAITSFGGLCAMAQTNSVIQKNGLSIFWYAGSKLFSGFFAFFLCLLWLLC